MKNIEAANTWAFFQAKNIRRQSCGCRSTSSSCCWPANRTCRRRRPRAHRREDCKKYRADEVRLTSEPKTGEGVDELWSRPRRSRPQRDRAMVKDPYFDYGQALLQIAIVLASVAIITGGTMPFGAERVAGGLGTLSTLNGFTLLFASRRVLLRPPSPCRRAGPSG